MSSRMIYVVFVVIFFVAGCRSNGDSEPGKPAPGDTAAILKDFATSPALTPEESIKKMQIEPGFQIGLVAAEPMVTAPVALRFDENGRMWVVEMNGYMPDTSGHGEMTPNGRIVILSDTNDDGIADDRKIFLDSLILPRAICLIENGLLVAEPPRLYFVERRNDRAGKKTVVDDEYAVGGNAEHQANGLMRGLDNWIYSANGTKRYRKKGNEWIIERTVFRGQWGITQDDYGRLFYNHNSANVLGDFFPPGLTAGNKNMRGRTGVNEKIVASNRVYPARPTTGVNRGYMIGILDSSLRLVNFTAACGPLYYRGGLFGDDFRNNVFVAEPSANLIKRNVLVESGFEVHGRQAYDNREFLASTDERFRPVSLYDGPDGALYIIDMYRGIIQHETYLTDYLKGEIVKRNLATPLACGRIYRIVPEGGELRPVKMPADAPALVASLGNPNGWIRDKAQQLLIDGRHTAIIPLLRDLLKSQENPLLLIHALWTLEGLNALTEQEVVLLLQNKDWKVRTQALQALPAVLRAENKSVLQREVERLLNKNDSLVTPMIAYLIQTFKSVDPEWSDKLMDRMMKGYAHDEYVSSALISNMENREDIYLKRALTINADTSLALIRKLQKVIHDVSTVQNKNTLKTLQGKYPRGVELYKTICQTCHGADGNGLKLIAPPLNRSEWVTGDKQTLTAIVLFGLSGPIQVDGKMYEPPEISGEMPGIAGNQQISDHDLAQLLNYVRNAWANRADPIAPDEIKEVREKYHGRSKPFTAEELY